MSQTNEDNGVTVTRGVQFSKGDAVVIIDTNTCTVEVRELYYEPEHFRDLAACLIAAADECERMQEPELPVVPDMPEGEFYEHKTLSGLWRIRPDETVVFYNERLHPGGTSYIPNEETLRSPNFFRRLTDGEARQRWGGLHTEQNQCF